VRRPAALLALLLAAAPAWAAPEPAPLNWARLRQMTPEAISRQLFGDLGQIMYLQPGQIPATDSFRRPFRDLRFLSRPRASYRAGVCETDWVTVEFRWAPGALGPDPAMRPRRIEVTTQFIVQNLAEARGGGPVVEEALARLETACAAIDPRDVQPIIATTAFDVTGTVAPLADLIEAARAGRALAPLECLGEDGEARGEAECLRELARLQPDKMFHAWLSAGCDRNETGLYCRNASVFDFGSAVEIRFEFRRGSAAPTRVFVKPALDTSSIE